jgi:hypothetical protein
LVTVPTEGDRVHFTAVLLLPLTLALKVADCPEVSDADVGVTATDTGTRERFTLALTPVAAWLVAVTMTFSTDEIEEGAV